MRLFFRNLCAMATLLALVNVNGMAMDIEQMVELEDKSSLLLQKKEALKIFDKAALHGKEGNRLNIANRLLSSIRFKDISLSRVRFNKIFAKRGTSFDGYLYLVKFKDSYFDNTSFSGTLKNVSFIDSQLRNTVFNDVIFKNNRSIYDGDRRSYNKLFSDSVLENVSFENCSFGKGLVFDNSFLKDVSFNANAIYGRLEMFNTSQLWNNNKGKFKTLSKSQKNRLNHYLLHANNKYINLSKWLELETIAKNFVALGLTAKAIDIVYDFDEIISMAVFRKNGLQVLRNMKDKLKTLSVAFFKKNIIKQDVSEFYDIVSERLKQLENHHFLSDKTAFFISKNIKEFYHQHSDDQVHSDDNFREWLVSKLKENNFIKNKDILCNNKSLRRFITENNPNFMYKNSFYFRVAIYNAMFKKHTTHNNGHID